MSEIVKIVGVDPALRNTGLCRVTYNSESDKFSVDMCMTLQNPMKFKGQDAIMNMLNLINDTSALQEFSTADVVIIEGPQSFFAGKGFCATGIVGISQVAGGCIPIFGLKRSVVVSPQIWKKSKKKEVANEITEKILGPHQSWKYHGPLKSETLAEHIIDAAGLALWWIKENFKESPCLTLMSPPRPQKNKKKQ